MAETKGVKIKFEADDSKLQSSLRGIENESKKLQKSLKEIDRLLELDPSNTTLLTQKQELLAKSIENTSKQLQAMESAQDKISAGYANWQKNKEAIEANKEAIEALRRKQSELTEKSKEAQKAFEAGLIPKETLNETHKAVGDVINQIRALKAEQDKLKGEEGLVSEDVYQKYITDTERLRINLQNLNKQQEQLNANLQGADSAADGAAKAVDEQALAAAKAAREEEERKKAVEQAKEADKKAKQSSKEYAKALDELKSSAGKVKDDIKGMATAVAAGITTVSSAVAAGTTAATKVGMEFTKSMSNVEALSGATAEEFEALEKAAADAGANTSKTASQAADALGYMALAGWDTSQMLDGLMPILRASEAGSMDLATCSDLVTDSMSAMGIAVGDLNHYLDVCTKAQSSSNTSLQQLLSAYVGCGGTLKNLNVSIEESASVLGTLANRGIKGAEAGNALNSILVNLVGANKSAANAMSALGVSAWDENGNFIGLANTLKTLNGALSTCTDEEKALFEARIGGKTQMDTLQALISGISGEYDNLNEKLNNAKGALESTAQTMQDNLSGDLTTLQSTLEGVGITIFDSLEEPFRSAAKEAISSFRRLNDNLSDEEMSESLKKVAEALKTLLTKAANVAADDAIPTLIKWLEWIADHGAGVQSTILSIGGAWAVWKIGSFASHIAAMVKALINYQAAAAAATASQVEMNAAAAVNPYVLLATAIAALVVGIVSYVKAKNDELKASREAEAAFSEETTALKEQAEAYKENAKEAEKNIKTIDHNADTMQSLWNEIQLLVDEEGRAKGSSEGLESAISRLNAISGENIEVVNGQITGYKDLKASMDDLIESRRNQAKLDYLQDDYVDAVYNIDQVKQQQADVIAQKEQFQKELDDANAKGEKAVEAYQAYLNDPANFKVEDWGFKDLEEIDTARYFDTFDLEKQVRDLKSQEQSLNDIVASYEKTITEYEDIATNASSDKVMDKNEAIAYGFQQDAKKIADENRKNAELAAMGVKQSWEDLVADLEDLDNQLAIKNISEDDYWEQRRQLLEDSQYKEDAEWHKYYDKVQDHYDKVADEDKKNADKQLKERQAKEKEDLENKIDALKLKEETEDSYTKEMLYNEMEILIAGLDKESDLYKKYNEEIIKGRKALADETSKTIKEGLKEDVSDIEDQIKKISSEYQTNIKKLLSDKDTYFNKLFDTSEFTSKSTQTVNGKTADVFSLSDPEEAYKKLNAYDKALDKLEKKGVSQNVLDWIDTLDVETAKNTIDTLNNMSDKKLQNYCNSFDKYKKKAEEMSSAKYDPQIEELNNGFVEKVNTLLGQLPNAAENTGVQTAQGFIKGLMGSNEDISTAVSTFTSNILDQIKSDLDIHSPSKETESLGEYTAKGFVNGFNAENMSDAVDTFADSFIAKLAEKDPDIRSALEQAFTGNMSAVISDMNALADTALSNIAAAVAEKVPQLPDISKLSVPTVEVSETVSSSSEAASLEQVSTKLDSVIELLNKLAISNSSLPIALDLTVSGRLQADMNSITAIIQQRFSNIAIQTGKKVFNY